MFLDLKGPLAEGETIPGSLIFEKAGRPRQFSCERRGRRRAGAAPSIEGVAMIASHLFKGASLGALICASFHVAAAARRTRNPAEPTFRRSSSPPHGKQQWLKPVARKPLATRGRSPSCERRAPPAASRQPAPARRNLRSRRRRSCRHGRRRPPRAVRPSCSAGNCRIHRSPRSRASEIDDTVNIIDTQDAIKYFPSLFVRKRNDGDTQSVLATRTWGISSSAARSSMPTTCC